MRPLFVFDDLAKSDMFSDILLFGVFLYASDNLLSDGVDFLKLVYKNLINTIEDFIPIVLEEVFARKFSLTTLDPASWSYYLP